MLAAFCLRLAAGMTACLLLLSPGRGPLVRPGFFRTHFLTALALACAGTLSAWPDAGGTTRAALAAGTGLAFLGALAWSLEGSPGGRALVALSALVLAGAAGLLAAAA